MSISGIARELATTSLFNNQLEKLPLTRLALKSVIENREQFALRRVRRAINHFIAIENLPSKSVLKEAAGVGYTYIYPSVIQAIDAGLTEISTKSAAISKRQ